VSFVQPEFPVFFGVVFALYWLLRGRIAQNVLLVVASAVFYGWLHPWFLLLLYGTALVDWLAGIGMARLPGRKGWVLAAALSANLGLLGWFKYADFFLGNVGALLAALGLEAAIAPVGVLLPVGISFYTFQSMAYSIDVYRGELAPRRRPFDYLLAVSFFAHLVAGPVQRASNLLQQAETARRFDLGAVRSGFGLALWGAFKKVVVADTLAPYVDRVYALPEPSWLLIGAATLGFSVQILADFSGYTDIARGTARMLGWELMENFRSPYLASSPSDFWRRWHVSFSTWIRDYLYIPLGGSRGGAARTAFATVASLLLSGLWHGASWNFVLWGAWHAALVLTGRAVGARVPAGLRASAGGHVLAVALTFLGVQVGWLLFRQTELDRLGHWVRTSPWVGDADQQVAAAVMAAVALAGGAVLVAAHGVGRHLVPWVRATPRLLAVETTAWAALAIAVLTFVRVDARDFIYFQF